jgi:nitric oxide reductase NorD protein
LRIYSDILKELAVADPDFAKQLAGHLTDDDLVPLALDPGMFAGDVVWALSLESSFGLAMALGVIEVLRSVPGQIPTYRRYVRQFGEKGPALGKIMAEHLTPVLKLDDPDLFDKFLHTIDIMLEKGVYTLYGPLKTVDLLCAAKDKESLSAYFNLLADTFALDLTYKQCRPFTYTLPTAVAAFAPQKRAYQTQQLCRVIHEDFKLSDSFLEGLSKGLSLLGRQSLEEFVFLALEKYRKNKKTGAKFLSLESKSGMDAFSAMQVTVPLSQVRASIHQYITARTGYPVSIKPLSALSKIGFADNNEHPWVCSDGKTIYLPDEIDYFADRRKNAALFKHLAKLETGFFEFFTFDFDLDKVRFRLGGEILNRRDHDPMVSDLEQFINSFPDKRLAADLFTLFEHSRIKDRLQTLYPGLIRQALPILQAEADSSLDNKNGCLQFLYQTLALNMKIGMDVDMPDDLRTVLGRVKAGYNAKMGHDPVVETSAELVLAFYPDIETLLKQTAKDGDWKPLKTPFQRKIDPQIYFSSHRLWDHIADLIKKQLAEKGIDVYRSDIRKRLCETEGSISLADIRQIVLSRPRPDDPRQPHAPGDGRATGQIDLSQLDLSQLMRQAGVSPGPEPDVSGQTFWHKEWDVRLGDYLHNHARVCRREIQPGENDFYDKTLDRYPGLASRIRYAFELMKPEGLVILRQWVEGDEFDYRALLDFAIDKKAGIMPSDRLYIKRIKKQRDVAVLLLVDLSRSTANLVIDSTKTVLTVEKEAIVLFCEALETVGDEYAVAGFSGSGRLGVDYFGIKDFDEALNQTVRQRISALSPQRSTRMGAAIRHAADQLEKVAAKVKLLIIIGDGFPNDVDYKKEYAISDTRRAIAEARSKNIHTHALTVNISGDPKLDDLYGRVHHHVIADVRALPDKLPRIYSTLTRY